MPARAIWKGFITFSGATVPVKLYSAVQDTAVHFHLLHDQDKARLQQRMVNPNTGKVVAEPKKGVEVEPGKFVLVTQEELASLEPEPSRDISVTAFVDPRKIGPQFFDRPYYLGPDGDNDAYFSLLDALEQEHKAGLAQWTMRKRTYRGSIQPLRGVLVLTTLRDPAEVIQPAELQAPAGRKLDARELKMARQLVEALAGDFDPAAFRNEHQDRLRELVERKAQGKTLRLHKPKDKKPTEKSLESVLRLSIDRARKEYRRAA